MLVKEFLCHGLLFGNASLKSCFVATVSGIFKTGELADKLCYTRDIDGILVHSSTKVPLSISVQKPSFIRRCTKWTLANLNNKQLTSLLRNFAFVCLCAGTCFVCFLN